MTDRIADALERIATALERQVAADPLAMLAEAMADAPTMPETTQDAQTDQIQRSARYVLPNGYAVLWERESVGPGALMLEMPDGERWALRR